MRVKLLIATVDIVYAKLISDNISEHHKNTIDVSICSALEGLKETLSKRKYNVALIDMEMMEHIDTCSIHLPMLLWSENDDADALPSDFERINKHQRISTIVSTILERYSRVSESRHGLESEQTGITAVWSPAGGVGKTTVALAYALSNASDGKEVFYLNLENFSSVPGFLNESGKSISSVFEMLENNDGNVRMLIQGISCCDAGITYLCGPDNFDDMCILSNKNIHELITVCSEMTDELVVDLSCIYDIRARKAFDIAKKIIIVTDSSAAAEIKLAQFLSQNNVYESIKEKVVFVFNKGAEIKPYKGAAVSFPYIQSNDAIDIYKRLSEDGWVESQNDL